MFTTNFQYSVIEPPSTAMPCLQVIFSGRNDTTRLLLDDLHTNRGMGYWSICYGFDQFMPNGVSYFDAFTF